MSTTNFKADDPKSFLVKAIADRIGDAIDGENGGNILSALLFHAASVIVGMTADAEERREGCVQYAVQMLRDYVNDKSKPN
jgi:hypothetical protein